MKLNHLFKKRSAIEAEIACRKAAAAEAATALALCDKLEAELPARIAELESEPVDVSLSSYAASEDFQGKGALLAQLWRTSAARALLADIPEIRKHWQAVAAART